MENVHTSLISELKNGSIDAFTQIYNIFFTPLYKFAFKYVRNKENAEEIVQSIFLKIWEKRSDINENLNFRSYLFQITINDVYNYFKKMHHGNNYNEYIKGNIKNNHEICYNDDSYIFKDYLEKVNDLINSLPPQRKLIFTLNKVDGKSPQEIATELNLSVRTVENQVFRASQYLRKQTESCSIF